MDVENINDEEASIRDNRCYCHSGFLGRTGFGTRAAPATWSEEGNAWGEGFPQQFKYADGRHDATNGWHDAGDG
jgi:hypothetical protein